MERKINLEPKDFSNLLRCLSALKGSCSDIDIRGGVLRQRSGDKSCIFEIDLTSLISDCDIALSDFKKKLPPLKTLSKQRVQITITDNDVFFSGKGPIFRFAKPDLSRLDNNFLSSEEWSKIFIPRDEDLLLEHLVTKDISTVTKVTCRQFEAGSFQLRFNGDTASITVATLSKDQYLEIESGIPLKSPLRGIINIIVTPFLIDHDRDIVLKVFRVEENVSVNQFVTSIGKLGVCVYSRSTINQDEEEQQEEKKEETEMEQKQEEKGNNKAKGEEECKDGDSTLVSDPD